MQLCIALTGPNTHRPYSVDNTVTICFPCIPLEAPAGQYPPLLLLPHPHPRTPRTWKAFLLIYTAIFKYICQDAKVKGVETFVRFLNVFTGTGCVTSTPFSATTTSATAGPASVPGTCLRKQTVRHSPRAGPQRHHVSVRGNYSVSPVGQNCTR